MSTFMAKASEVERKWYVIDAAGVPLGKTAVKASSRQAQTGIYPSCRLRRVCYHNKHR